MKPSELRALSEGDLHARIKELSQELTTLRLASRTSGVEKPHQVRTLRREIARIHTIAQELTRDHSRSVSAA